MAWTVMKLVKFTNSYGVSVDMMVDSELADAFEKMQAEVARLRAELDAARRSADEADQENSRLTTENASLLTLSQQQARTVSDAFERYNAQRIEVSRLRGALEKIGERVGRWLAEPEAPDTGDLTLLATEIEWTLGAQHGA